MTRVLIAEDDVHLRRGLMELLALEGFDCAGAADGVEALELFERDPPDFLVIDVMMPGMDGVSLCRAIRGRDPVTPILMLTARGEEIDRVLGLESGADDYMVKPFGPRELVARIKAILRRDAALRGVAPAMADKGSTGEHRFRMDDLEIDPAALRAHRGGAVVDLTTRELRILEALRDRAGRVVGRDELFDLCWGRDFMPNSRALDQSISVLRRKIERDPASPRIIRTVHGVGYRYEGDRDAAGPGMTNS